MNETIGFNEIIKKSFLELANYSDISVANMLIGLIVTFAIGLFIHFIYRVTFQGVVYNQSFNKSLVILSLITSLVIMTISSNIVLSLGMVGALSIVRFRAAIKDPSDIVYMFWAIAAGISSGAGNYPVAVGGSLFIGGVILLMSKKKFEIDTYLLVIRYGENAQENVFNIINKLDYFIKSKTVANKKTELTLELRKVGENTSFVDLISEIEGVDSAILLKYSGDYAE